MTEKPVYEARITDEVQEFITGLPEEIRAKLKAQVNLMELNEFDGLHVKTLRKQIKELIIKKYRFIYFVAGKCIYFIDGFVKKTQKTPKRVIDRAEKAYKVLS